MNKKAIMVKFLTTVLLAIIIFAPACYVASSFFRLSEQGKENFIKFVDKVKEMESEGQGDKVALLIMDEGTALVYFEPYQKEVQVDVTTNSALTFHFLPQNPGRCSEDKGCLCLFREPEYKALGAFVFDGLEVNDPKAFCQEMNIPLKIKDCSLGIPHDVKSYTCLNGFIIDRNLGKTADSISVEVPDNHFEVGRRTQIKLTREVNSILLEG